MSGTYRKSWSILFFLLTVGCYFPEIELSEAERQEVEQSLFSNASEVNPKIKVGAIIEDQIRLIGIDLSRSSARPNDVVEITYYIESLIDQTQDNTPLQQHPPYSFVSLIRSLYFGPICVYKRE